MAEYVCKDMGIQAGGGTAGVRWHRKERVVRCRDCRHARPSGLTCGWFYCGNFNDPSDDSEALVEPDGFCAWGKTRKENDDD